MENKSLSNLRFNIRGLLTITAITAVAIGIVFNASDFIAGVMLLSLTFGLPAWFTVVLVYGRGLQRTFAIGAIFPAGVCLVLFSLAMFGDVIFGGPISRYREFVEFFNGVGNKFRGLAAIQWALMIVVGLLSIVLRLTLQSGIEQE